MFESNKPDAQINLIDFGLSKKYGPGEYYMHEGVGTIYTMAPQVLQGVYTSKADLWSIGVISFMLLSSEKPFFSRERYAGGLLYHGHFCVCYSPFLPAAFTGAA
jgi:serine/threonine protein kinase